MKKISQIFEAEKKKDFKSDLEITLENGTVITGSIEIRDISESYASEQVQSLFKNAKIKSVKQIKIEGK